MQARKFLDLAREIIRGGTEVHWRGALGRAYYAMMLESREALLRWGFTIPPRDNVHVYVRLRYTYASHTDLKKIGYALDKIGQYRNRADYDLRRQPVFQNEAMAATAIQEAAEAIDLIDEIEADAARLAAAIAAIRKAFP